MRINENVALAKAILNKQGITTDSPEYKDYLKIREICGTGHGYVGILTRIRFQDGVTDMDEIISIYEILKNSKIDVGKLNKMTYDDILNIFYDEFKTSEKNEDYEVLFKDSEYTYYQVHTYKGIMKTGSPSWCLKTKSNWDEYQSVYPKQFVVVSNRYKNRLVVPDDDILSTYSSKKGFVRFGISVNDSNANGVVKWTACDDNNRKCEFEPDNWTFWGVMCTLLNVLTGINKSYYDSFRGCRKLDGTKSWHEIINPETAFERFNFPKDFFDEKFKLYMTLSTTYSSRPAMLVMSDSCPRIFYPTRAKHDVKFSNLSTEVTKKILEDYANQSNSVIFYGIKLKKKTVDLDEVKKNKDFITMVDNWIIFNRNKYIVAVNSNPIEYNLPTLTVIQEQFNFGDEDPLFFYIKKDGMIPVGWTDNLIVTDYHQKVIDSITGKNSTINEPEPRVKKFWDLFKKK